MTEETQPPVAGQIWQDLLDRLKALTGPSREIDDRIAAAFGWTLVDEVECLWRGPAGEIQQTPRYTEDIHAALTLTRPGWSWDVGTQGERYYGQVRAPKFIEAEGATPAIAILIAIMEAKEAAKQTDTTHD